MVHYTGIIWGIILGILKSCKWSSLRRISNVVTTRRYSYSITRFLYVTEIKYLVMKHKNALKCVCLLASLKDILGRKRRGRMTNSKIFYSFAISKTISRYDFLSASWTFSSIPLVSSIFLIWNSFSCPYNHLLSSSSSFFFFTSGIFAFQHFYSCLQVPSFELWKQQQ